MANTKLALWAFALQTIFEAPMSAATLLRSILRTREQVTSLPDPDRQLPERGAILDAEEEVEREGVEKEEDEADSDVSTVRRRRRRRRGSAPEVDPELQKPQDCECPPQNFVTSSTQKSVLFIGDSLYQGESGSENYITRDLDEHDINASFVENTAQGYCGTSNFWVQCLDAVLQDTNWDAVSYNWGLHDICPSTYAEVTLDQHKATLKLVYETLRAKLGEDAYIVFQKSTPVGPDDSKRNITDVIAINDALDEVAAEYDPPIPVNDVYQPIVDKCRDQEDSTHYPNKDTCPTLQESEDPHFTAEGRELFGKLVSQPILDALNVATTLKVKKKQI